MRSTRWAQASSQAAGSAFTPKASGHASSSRAPSSPARGCSFSTSRPPVSTFPDARSGWLRRNLLERLRADTKLPLDHVEVEAPAEVAV